MTVTLDKTGEINVKEGKIHTDEEATVKASASVNGAGGSLIYQWYKCNALGELESPVDGRYVQKDKDGLTMRIPETLTEGTYYYLCNVKLFWGGETAIVEEEQNSNVVKVVVADGPPVVILDPNGGAFAEIINNTQPLDVELGSDGKVPADYHNMMTGKEGWKFVGWYMEDADGEEYQLTPISGMDGYEFPSDGMVIYAKWSKLDDSPAAGDDNDVMPWMMAAGLAVLAGSAVRFRKKSTLRCIKVRRE